MPLPAAAGVAYLAMTGGGIGLAVCGGQRFVRYLRASPSEQEAEDQRFTPSVKGAVQALAGVKLTPPVIDGSAT